MEILVDVNGSDNGIKPAILGSIKALENAEASITLVGDEYKIKEVINEEYKEEIESSFTTLFYVNTLFSYMMGVKKLEISFIKKMGEEMRKTFPDFRKNKYYQERVHAEERKLIDMHMKSDLYFILYYKLLWAYRNLRKKLGI